MICTASKWPVRIQYKCLVPIYVLIPEIKCAASLFSKQNQNDLSPNSYTLLYLWELYIFPGSVCLFCSSQICGPILGLYKSVTYTWMWKLGLRPLNSQKRIHKWGFRCSWSVLRVKTTFKPWFHIPHTLLKFDCRCENNYFSVGDLISCTFGWYLTAICVHYNVRTLKYVVTNVWLINFLIVVTDDFKGRRCFFLIFNFLSKNGYITILVVISSSPFETGVASLALPANV